jgi:hypothetical protein
MCDEGSLPAEAERQGAGDVKWTKSLVAEVLKLAMASERERAISILLNIQHIIKYIELILQVGL